MRFPRKAQLSSLLTQGFVKSSTHFSEGAVMAVQTQQKNANPRKAQDAQNENNSAEREQLLAGLNSDLAGEYQAILMYTYFSAKLTGPYRKELRALFQGEITDEQGHAQFLADKIA